MKRRRATRGSALKCGDETLKICRDHRLRAAGRGKLHQKHSRLPSRVLYDLKYALDVPRTDRDGKVLGMAVTHPQDPPAPGGPCRGGTRGSGGGDVTPREILRGGVVEGQRAKCRPEAI